MAALSLLAKLHEKSKTVRSPSYGTAKTSPTIFTIPTAAEGTFVAKIYGVAHFQQNIEQQKLLNGGRNADPFCDCQQ